MNNLSFSHSIHYPFWDFLAIFIKFGIVVCKLFQFGRILNSLFGNGLKLLQMDQNTLAG